MKKIFGFFALFLLSFYSTSTLSAYTGEIHTTITDSSVQKTVAVKITDITPHSANIEWEKVDGYNGFTVYYDTKSLVDNYRYHSAVLTGTGTLLKNLTPNTDYYLVIKAFDSHANEILISEEIKFTTRDGESSAYGTSNATKNGDDLQSSSTVYSSSSIADSNAGKTTNDYLDGSHSGGVLLGTEQIKKLPKTGPASYIIVALSLIISFVLIHLLKMKANLKK
ncbi:MAG: fibronectin type III domain-containing protein [Candidatus Gracilibacteria bacterium]|nr:fibronectin type III domain-containing protein [Candidatus Gracilibacteria bacterium]